MKKIIPVPSALILLEVEQAFGAYIEVDEKTYTSTKHAYQPADVPNQIIDEIREMTMHISFDGM